MLFCNLDTFMNHVFTYINTNHCDIDWESSTKNYPWKVEGDVLVIDTAHNGTSRTKIICVHSLDGKNNEKLYFTKGQGVKMYVYVVEDSKHIKNEDIDNRLKLLEDKFNKIFK